MSGELSVLNCGKGDIRITLDKENPLEVLKAKRMIQDMLRRGYLLAIEVNGELKPVDSFDAEAGEYIVYENALYSGGEMLPEDPVVDAGKVPPIKKAGGKKNLVKTRHPMEKTKATAVPRTAGG